MSAVQFIGMCGHDSSDDQEACEHGYNRPKWMAERAMDDNNHDRIMLQRLGGFKGLLGMGAHNPLHRAVARAGRPSPPRRREATPPYRLPVPYPQSPLYRHITSVKHFVFLPGFVMLGTMEELFYTFWPHITAAVILLLSLATAGHVSITELAATLDQCAEERILEARPLTFDEVNGRILPVKLRDGLARLFAPYL